NPAVLQQTQDDLRSLARTAVVRSATYSAAVVLLLLLVATLIWRNLRPRWAIIAIGTTTMALIYGGTALRAQSTFDTGAFETPTYFAQGDEIGQILDLATEVRLRTGYGDDFTSIVSSISATLTGGNAPDPGGLEVYAGSDLHANALVIDPVAQLVGESPLFLTGDFGQRGSEAEASLLAPRVAALGKEVVAVSGNHDSGRLMQKLANEGVIVLGQRGQLGTDGTYSPPPVIDIEGLAVAGFRDPLEYSGKDAVAAERAVTAEDLPDPKAATERWRQELIDWFTSLPTQPAIVMIHQDGLAQWFAGALREAGYIQPLTILTGHDHRQHVDRYGDIIVVDGGTIGAGGIFDVGKESVGLARLRFSDQLRLESVDLIAVEPISGAARATRVVIDSLCPVERRCSVKPDDDKPELPAELTEGS
ncbi:MAG: metallophosphoesterase family protein, partial [Solirubrobacterales bacterium]